MAIAFGSGDEAVDLGDRLRDEHRRIRRRGLPLRIHGVDECRQVGREMVLSQEFHQQAMRAVGVARADADGAEEIPISWMSRDELADALPEQEQRAVVLLISRRHERSSELERRRADAIEQERVVAKEGPRIEPFYAVCRDELVGLREAIRAGYLPLLAI